MTLFGTYISFQFLVTQYLQTLSGWSALSSALAFLPQADQPATGTAAAGVATVPGFARDSTAA